MSMSTDTIRELVRIKSETVNALTISGIEQRARIAFLDKQLSVASEARDTALELSQYAASDASLATARSCAFVLVKRAYASDCDSARLRWVIDTTIDTVVEMLSLVPLFLYKGVNERVEIVTDVYATAFGISGGDEEGLTLILNLKERLVSIFEDAPNITN